MAIIYTYPTQTTANGNDLILITNTDEEENPTYNIKVSKLAGQMSAYANNISWEQTLLVDSTSNTGARFNSDAWLTFGTVGDPGNIEYYGEYDNSGVMAPGGMASYGDYNTDIAGTYKIETHTCSISIDNTSPGGEFELIGLKSFADNTEAIGELNAGAVWMADGTGSIEKGTLMIAY